MHTCLRLSRQPTFAEQSFDSISLRNVRRREIESHDALLTISLPLDRFHTDTESEIELIKRRAKAAGAFDAVESTHFTDGGKGAVKLAKVR